MESFLLSNANVNSILQNIYIKLNQETQIDLNDLNKDVIIKAINVKLKDVYHKIDKTRLNQNNIKSISNQINTSVCNKVAHDIINIISQQQQTKPKKNINMERPLTTRDKLANEQVASTMDKMLNERKQLDNMIGFRQPETVALKQNLQEETIPEFLSVNDNDGNYASMNSFDHTITNGEDIDEEQFESYNERLKRIQNERSNTFMPTNNNNNNEQTAQKHIGQDNYVVRQQLVTNENKTINKVLTNSNYVTNKDNYVTNKDNYVTNKNDYVTDKDNYVTDKDNYVTDKDNYVTNGGDKAVDKHITKLNEEIENLKKQYSLLLQTNKNQEKIIENLKDKSNTQHIVNYPYLHILIDSSLFDTRNANGYVYHLPSSLNKIRYIEVLNIDLPVTAIQTISSSLYLPYKMNDLVKHVNINPGNYNIQTFIDVFNTVCVDFSLALNYQTDCLYVEYNTDKQINLVENIFWSKLGFDTTSLTAIKPYDLRPSQYVDLYITNLSEYPITKINRNHFTPFIIHFDDNYELSDLSIEFRNNYGFLIDFRDMYHLIELKLHIIY